MIEGRIFLSMSGLSDINFSSVEFSSLRHDRGYRVRWITDGDGEFVSMAKIFLLEQHPGKNCVLFIWRYAYI